MRVARGTLVALSSVAAFAAVVPVAHAKTEPTACTISLGQASVASPTRAAAWRAGIQTRTAVSYRFPGNHLRAARWVAPTDAQWLMVIARPRAVGPHCWLRVRLPWRPNDAAGWVNADKVTLEETPWLVRVSTAQRTLTLLHAGKRVRTVPVVVGKPSTPTPVGLFAITWAIPWHPDDFLGSWVLELTGHSDVLQQFDGGDGTVGIHGRGGASLLDPL